MRLLRSIVLLLVLAVAAPAYAQSTGDVLSSSGGSLDASSGALLEPIEEEPVVEPAKPLPEAAWIDVAKVIDQFRIKEKLADLRAVTTDATGKNYGFYFASGRKKSVTVYRNGRQMLKTDTETLQDMYKPAVFRMTGSGDLLYAVHGTDLYVNETPVSLDMYSFSTGVSSVHDEGGVLTFPEGGNVVTYNIARNDRRVLYKHAGAIQYLRRVGGSIAYTVRERGFNRMYRSGRRVSARGVENPSNFAISAAGDVYYFTKVPRGYALYRNSRSFLTGKGAGAYVALDKGDLPWHISYLRLLGKTFVRLQKGRSPADLLPPNIVNAELFLAFIDGGYALRGSFADDPSSFFLVRDGETLGEEFRFEFPHNDTHGLAELDGRVVMRAHNGTRWTAYVDGESLSHATLKNVWFTRVYKGELTVYATK